MNVGKIYKPYTTNAHGVNDVITTTIFDDATMRKLGFTDYAKDTWFYWKSYDEDISFNVSIKKNDPTDFRIDVLDENFCQPYDYQYILSQNANHSFANKINDFVEAQMQYLTSIGIIHGHVVGEYI